MSIRVLQYNILADGLSDDGFVCSDHLTTITGDTHTIPEFLSKIQDIKHDRAKLDELAKLYETEENNQIYAECLDWSNRWNKITNLIQTHNPDILVFQEMDHYAEALNDLEKLGYFSSYDHTDEKYFPLWADPNVNANTYLTFLSDQNHAFIPKLDSKARKFALKRGIHNPDNDGCAIFWKKDRFYAKDIRFCQFYRYNSDKKDKDGALSVILHDRTTHQNICVITTHLPSGQTRERELERLEILSNTDRGVFRDFIERMRERCPKMIIALDANSDPFETYSEDSTDHNVWRSFKDIPNLQSIWDQFMDSHVTPVTVNKIRGPKSNQPKKIGVHSYELIDHVFYSGLTFDRFVSPLMMFDTKELSLNNLIPNQHESSDHYPVIVDLF